MNAALPASTKSILRLARPPQALTAAFLRANAERAFTYEAVGASTGELPKGWNPHVVEGVIGHGEADFEAAAAAIAHWCPFDLGWVHIIDGQAPLQVGQVVGFSSQQIGLWTINVCRIVLVVDEDDQQGRRFGFAYGTLPDHAVRGEELFSVCWDRATDEVRFTIRKFSRPGRWWARLAGPISRAIQARFSHDALARMQRAVAEAR